MRKAMAPTHTVFYMFDFRGCAYFCTLDEIDRTLAILSQIG